MRAPAFWQRPSGFLAAILAPASLFWRFGTWLRRVATRPQRVAAPVLCVGNLTAGGAGKTPMVAALLARCAGLGIAAHVVSRGHGGREHGPLRVDPERHGAGDVGDEPLLLAARAPVWVARDRAAGARAAAAAGAALVILDDGFQNPGLVKDAAILMIDAAQGFGNGRVIPAGPLREPVSAGLGRADLAVIVRSEGDGGAATAALLAAYPALARSGPVPATLRPLATGLDLDGAPVVAFAGIGIPEKFFRTLRAMGARLLRAEAFPDHHVYAPAVLSRLANEARASGAMLVTTEKDAVRLPAGFRGEIMTVQVELVPENWGRIDALLHGLVRK